jgi:hypothetical protein
MNMLLIIAGLVLAAIVVTWVLGGSELDELRRQQDLDQPNPRGDLR